MSATVISSASSFGSVSGGMIGLHPHWGGALTPWSETKRRLTNPAAGFKGGGEKGKEKRKEKESVWDSVRFFEWNVVSI